MLGRKSLFNRSTRCAIFQLAVKFIFGVGAFHFGEFVFDFTVARDQVLIFSRAREEFRC